MAISLKSISGNLFIFEGTTAENNALVGPAGRFSFDTQKNEIRRHDGVKAGGFVLGSNAYGNLTVSTAGPTGGTDGDIWLKI